MRELIKSVHHRAEDRDQHSGKQDQRVQDEGEGFQDLEKWNEFNKKRLECLHNNDFLQLADYVSFRTKESDSQDGGNALFAALEYWNGGFVYNGKRNAVAMLKKYQQKYRNVNHDGE